MLAEALVPTLRGVGERLVERRFCVASASEWLSGAFVWCRRVIRGAAAKEGSGLAQDLLVDVQLSW